MMRTPTPAEHAESVAAPLPDPACSNQDRGNSASVPTTAHCTKNHNIEASMSHPTLIIGMAFRLRRKTE